MTAGATPEVGSGLGGGLSRDRVLWMASIAFCGVLPALVLVLVFAAAIGDGSYGIDFRQVYHASQDVLAGRNPYPDRDALLTASGEPWVYPPLLALLLAPLTLLPIGAASVLVMLSLVAVALAVPYALGVRDWRCYGIVMLWPPVISAIQTGNVTLWLALAAALAWRFRDRLVPASASVGIALAVKFLLWPLARVVRGDAPACERLARSRDRARAPPRVMGRHRLRRTSRLSGSPSAAPGRRRRRRLHAHEPRR